MSVTVNGTVFKFLFMMALSAGAMGSDIALKWDLPTEREDGSRIESIDMLKIYQTINNSDVSVIEVDSASTSYQAHDVEVGLYTFQISTVEDGQEGALSDPISVNVSPVLKSKPIKMLISIELIE